MVVESEKKLEIVEETHTYKNVTLYRVGMFGVARTDCRELRLALEQKFAQYNSAIRYQYLEKGKRKRCAYVMTDPQWMRVVETAVAIDPDPSLVEGGDGVKVSRYTNYDPRWITDFEDKLAGVPVLFAVGVGERV